MHTDDRPRISTRVFYTTMAGPDSRNSALGIFLTSAFRCASIRSAKASGQQSLWVMIGQAVASWKAAPENGFDLPRACQRFSD